MPYREQIHNKVIDLGKDVLRMTTHAGSGHPSSGLSILHLVTVLMYDVMRYDPADPWNPANDRLVLSEGHAVPAIYAAYADLGGMVGKTRETARKLTKADLATLREAQSVLDGHPNPAEGFHFFDAATGSLGQGLSVAAGLALAAQLSKLDRKIYCIMGDGESREGQIWEAMDMIAERKLTAVTAIFNCNGQGQADYVSPQQSADSLTAKAQAFGCQTVVIDGHDPDAIKKALTMERSRPLAIIAKTQKGWGCPSITDKSNHGKPVPPDKLEAALTELEATRAKLSIASESLQCAPRPQAASPKPAPRAIPMVKFEDAIEAVGLTPAVQKNAIATRRAYGAALAALGAADPRIVALDGDVSNSTFADMFAKKFPQRFVECKIAEQNMISAAAGFSAAGYIPFVSTFAKFLSRGYDQIEMAQISRANIKLVGSHSGISLAADGPSQMSLQDVAYFRTASQTDNGFGHPACVSFHPSDAVAAYHCTWLMANHDGMCYMRTHRPEVPLLYAPQTHFELGGSHILMEGNALTIVSAGYMVHVCKQAAEALAQAGIKCTLIDAYSFPLNAAPILAAAEKTQNRILCVEDNYLGGLGGAVAEAAAADSRYLRVQMMTCTKIPKSAKTTEDILAYCGLSAKDIAERARSMIAE
jgi:transketolase